MFFKHNTYVLWHGVSQLDGKTPIMLVASGFTKPSANAKLGPYVIQTWILLKDQSPTVAISHGNDDAVCGSCKHRPANNGSCYVTAFQAPLSIWKSWQRGNVPDFQWGDSQWRENLAVLLRTRLLRCGAYGDPMAVPLAQWQLLLTFAKRRTGYTHQWSLRDSYPRISKSDVLGYKQFLMASVDNDVEFVAARNQGWKTFRVRRADAPLRPTEVQCPSQTRPESVSCHTCGLCDASHKPVSVTVHGSASKVKAFATAQQ